MNDFIAFELSGDKRGVEQFVLIEFHLSAVCKCSNPLIVWHFRYPTNFKCRRRLQILDEECGARAVRSDHPQARQRQERLRQYKPPTPINSIFGSGSVS